MALGDNYATLSELKAYMSITGSTYDTELTQALGSASREIERFCRRQFNDSGAASARVYYASNNGDVTITDDFHTTSGLVVETDDLDDGTYATAWTSADYQLEPLNGIRGGMPGWPYWKVRAIDALSFPSNTDRAPVRVTARWGWAAVPAPIKTATLILASKNFQLKDTPFGVAGFGEFGMVRVGDDRMAANKVAPYVRNKLQVK
jgi:hypothetical protein